MNGNWENQDQQFQAVRPLVRYVDETQAVLDTHIAVACDPKSKRACATDITEIRVVMTDPNGDRYEHQSTLHSLDTGMLRFEIDDPQRWWPAGMGDQVLYELTVDLILDDQVIDTWQTSIGLTSVRPAKTTPKTYSNTPKATTLFPSNSKGDQASVLLVNGQERAFHSVITLSPTQEDAVLPITGDSLVVVQDHFGSDRLYDAADRAGILVVQSVQNSYGPDPRMTIIDEVNRLTAHPSLAGWCIQTDNRAAGRVVHHIHQLDPTRSIFRSSSDLN